MQGTKHTTRELKENFDHALQLVRTLRDEIVVDLHLAGMDAKDEWQKLEQRFAHFEAVSKGAAGAGLESLEQLSKALKAFREALKKPAPRS